MGLELKALLGSKWYWRIPWGLCILILALNNNSGKYVVLGLLIYCILTALFVYIEIYKAGKDKKAYECVCVLCGKPASMFVDGKKFCGGHSKPIAPLFNNKMNFLARKIYN